MIFKSGVYQIVVDELRTERFYKQQTPVSCDCAGCRNFTQASSLLPPPVREFFRQFGICIEKPAEMSASHSPDGNTIFYSGFYHICGSICEGKEPMMQLSDRAFRLDDQYLLNIAPHVDIYFTEDCALVDPTFPAPVIQLNVHWTLPWVLEEVNPYIESVP